MTTRRQVISASIAVIAVFAAAYGMRAHRHDDSRMPSSVYFGSRFAQLTSEVWRYGSNFTPKDLPPVPNNNPYAEPQPHRDRPIHATLNAEGTKLYVTLQGRENDPGREVVVIDVASRKPLKRIRVGSRPYKAYLHPGGRFLVVINELSNYASVIDTRTDKLAGLIELDYYCQGLAFAKDGKRAWVANRYLDQVLVVKLEENSDSLTGHVEQQGGFDEKIFFGEPQALSKEELKAKGYTDTEIQQATVKQIGGVNGILRARCRNCHLDATGKFQSGSDRTQNFLSAIENAIPGKPFASPLLRAVTPTALGGYGDSKFTGLAHAGGVQFTEDDADLAKVADWIRNAEDGPGIRVGNEQSHPKDIALSSDGKYLYVGNTGTQDVSIIDTEVNREVGAILIQNVPLFLALHKDQKERERLIVLTMGAGFGTAPARDPLGGETWDKKNPAAQYTVLRDPKSTDPYPLDQQFLLGPYDATDGTWNFKMRDIQNDIVLVELSELNIPKWKKGMSLDYLLRANRYENHRGWVRYTSDTAEATVGDIKGDIPPELQRVPGAMPEWAELDGNKLYVSMSGTFEIVEWKVRPDDQEGTERLVPERIFNVGFRPIGLALGRTGPAQGKLFAVNQLSESVGIIDLNSGTTEEVAVGDRMRPPLDTDAEKGELIAHSSVFSSDGDTSCLHCHYRDTGDGRAWGAGEVVGQNRKGHITHGGTLGIPQVKNLYATQPFYFEGTHLLSEGQGGDINEPSSSLDFDRPIWAGDFTQIQSPIYKAARRELHEELKERVEIRKLGDHGYDLEERRTEFLRQQSMKYFGAAHDLTDFYRFVGEWMGATNRLLPNPFDRENPSVKRGRALFSSSQVMCSVCHTAPEFTNKTVELANNDRRALPQLTTVTRRDASYTLPSVHFMQRVNGDETDLGREDLGRVEEKEGTFTTMQLRGIFDRPPVFLHHGRARSLREVVLTPNHPATRDFRYPVFLGDEEVRKNRKETGFNETTQRTPRGDLDPRNQVFDTHGGTSHLSIRQMDDLVNFMKSIE